MDLLAWCSQRTASYGINVLDLKESWVDGRALVVLIHSVQLSLFNYEEALSHKSTSPLSIAHERIQLASSYAKQLGIETDPFRNFEEYLSSIKRVADKELAFALTTSSNKVGGGDTGSLSSPTIPSVSNDDTKEIAGNANTGEKQKPWTDRFRDKPSIGNKSKLFSNIGKKETSPLVDSPSLGSSPLSMSESKVQLLQLGKLLKQEIDQADELPIRDPILISEEDIANDSNWRYLKAIKSYTRNGDIDRVTLCLDMGLDIDTLIGRQRNTVLIIATDQGHINLVRYLLARGADHNLFNRDGHTALFVALQKGYTDISKLLHKRFSCVDQRDKSGSNALLNACARGHIDVVKWLVARGANPNFVGKKGYKTPLIIASKYGNTEVFQYLASCGADPNIVDKKGRSPFTMAAKRGNTEILKYLVSIGVDPHYYSKKTKPALVMAAKSGNIGTLQYLISMGAGVNIADESGKTPLMSAACSGNSEAYHHLISVKANHNDKDKLGNTLLMCAAKGGNLDIIRQLFRKLGKVNAQNRNGESALLQAAATHSKLDVLDCLIERGANPNLDAQYATLLMSITKPTKHKNKSDIQKSIKRIVSKGVNPNAVTAFGTMLHQVCRTKNSLDIVKCLESIGADRWIPDNGGTLPVMIAAEEGNIDVVIHLLGGVRKKLLSKMDGTTLLMAVARGGDMKLFQYLVRNGSDKNKLNQNGQTAFIYAARNCKTNIVKYFIESGADPNHIEGGQTILCEAARVGNIGVVQYLVSVGADPNKSNTQGETPVMLAAASGHVDIVKYFISIRADIHKIDKCGKNAIHHAVVGLRNNPAVELLLSSGMDPNSTDNDGATPLIYADNKKAMRQLLKYGADVSRQSNDGRTALTQSESDVKKLRLLIRAGADLNTTYKGTTVGISLLNTYLNYGAARSTADAKQLIAEIIKNPLLDFTKTTSNGASIYDLALTDKTLWVAECIVKGKARDAKIRLTNQLRKEFGDSPEKREEYLFKILQADSSLKLNKYEQRKHFSALLDALTNPNCVINNQSILSIAISDDKFFVFAKRLLLAGATVDEKLMETATEKWKEVLATLTPKYGYTTPAWESEAECLLFKWDFNHKQEIKKEGESTEVAITEDVEVGDQQWEFDAVITTLKSDRKCCNRPATEKLFFAACARGYINLVKRLIEWDSNLICATNKWGTTPLHLACFVGNIPIAELLLRNGADIAAMDAEARLPIRIALENHREILRLFSNSLAKMPYNDILEKFNKRPKVSFSGGRAKEIPISILNGGWISNQPKEGALIVDDSDVRPIVLVTAHMAYGVLEGGNVFWEIQNKKDYAPFIPGREFQLFYGLPELDTNLVWKQIDSDPSIFLNFYHKSKEFMRPLIVVTRRKVNGRYQIGTLKSSIELLDVFGSSISQVFPDTEVLCLRNIAGEGISLTHDEYDLLASQLVLFPRELSQFLLQNNNNVPSLLEDILLGDFIVWLLHIHPLSGQLRLCNKIVSLLQKSAPSTHARIVAAATELQQKIDDKNRHVYHDLLEYVDLSVILEKINTLQPKVTINNQVTLTGVPKWWDLSKGEFVDELVVVQLLMNSAELSDWAPKAQDSISKIDNKINDTQQHIVRRLTDIFVAEFKPTHDDLLAKAYIKIAHQLRPLFREKLCAAFTEDRVAIAPIKDLRRCKAKLTEIKNECEAKNPIEPPPYASRILDYLRATVFCDSIEDMVKTLEKLGTVFPITRIKPRLDPNVMANKIILVNLIVEDPAVKPNLYKWSQWWDRQDVRMIAEVQISIKDMFYLDKQSHSAYEIRRTTKCEDWEYQQGYDEVELELFPMSPLHHDPLCLL